MKQMFASATIKLTAWYLVILMLISIFFSAIIYQISSSEVRSRLHFVEESFPIPIMGTAGNTYSDFQQRQLQEVTLSLFVALFYSNIAILILGGVGSYFLARRTLRPIEEFQELQTRFISDASHELRTPLAIMKSELEVAERDKTLTKEDMRELLQSNLEEVDRLTVLSDTLLKLSRRDFSELDFSLTDIRNILEKIIASHKDLPTKRFKLTGPKKLIVRANTPSIRELFVILIDNALRYSPDDSTIHIKLREEASSISITISNSGPGILAEDLPHIFDRFYRGEKSRASSGGGYGLGLSLAKNIVQLHDGKIAISSTPNKITSVLVTLKKSFKK